MPRKKTQEINDPSDVFRSLGEKIKASSRTPNIHGYTPHEKQLLFHQSTARSRLYIGGNRSGKTTGGVIEDLWWLKGEHPYRDDVNERARNGGCYGRVIAVDFIQGVDKIILPQFARWIPPSWLINGSWSDSYDQSRRVLTLENRSFVEFMSYDQDLDKFAGTSRDFVHYDEEPPEVIKVENDARLIDRAGSSWYTMTPVEGMTWLYDSVYIPGKRGDSGIEVIEVDMTDNPHLNRSEIDLFISGLSQEEREARVHGRFIQLGGVIYKQFDAKLGGKHVLSKPVDISSIRDWLWTLSLDHGFNNPTAALWHAVSPDGQALTFKEHYKSGWTIDKHAAYIHHINKQLGKVPDFFIADPSIRNTDPISGTSIHQEYIKYGIPFMLANNDVKAGIVRVNKYMNDNALTKRPRWNVTPDCLNLIKELQRYRWKTYSSKKVQSQHNPFEEPNKKDDHACDSLRYFIMSQPDLEGGYGVLKDEVRSEFQEIYNTASQTFHGKADPWNKIGDLPGNPSDYTVLEGNVFADEYMGAEY